MFIHIALIDIGKLEIEVEKFHTVQADATNRNIDDALIEPDTWKKRHIFWKRVKKDGRLY